MSFVFCSLEAIFVLEDSKYYEITYFEMIPVAAIHEGSIHEHLLKMAVVFSVLIRKNLKMVEVGDACVLWIPANKHDFAAAGQKFRRKQRKLEKGHWTLICRFSSRLVIRKGELISKF